MLVLTAARDVTARWEDLVTIPAAALFLDVVRADVRAAPGG